MLMGQIIPAQLPGGNTFLRDRTLLNGTRLRLQITTEANGPGGPKVFTLKDMAKWKSENPMGERALDQLDSTDRVAFANMALGILELMAHVPPDCTCPKGTMREGITLLILLSKYQEMQSINIQEADNEVKQWADANPNAYKVMDGCVAARRESLRLRGQPNPSVTGAPTLNAPSMMMAQAPDPPDMF